MRAVLAAAMLMAGLLPASAGVFADKDGTLYEIVDPPADWFDRPAPRIEPRLLPRERAFLVCKLATKKAGQFGCATAYQTVCDVTVVEDLPKPLRDAVMRHERAHCHGWPADHPVD